MYFSLNHSIISFIAIKKIFLIYLNLFQLFIYIFNIFVSLQIIYFDFKSLDKHSIQTTKKMNILDMDDTRFIIDPLFESFYALHLRTIL